MNRHHSITETVELVFLTDHPSWKDRQDGQVRAWKDPVGRILFVNTTSDTPTRDTVSQEWPKVVGSALLPGSCKDNNPRIRKVLRWPTTDLWEAIASGVIRQVIRANQARSLYQIAARNFGETVTPDYNFFPRPEQLLTIPASKFAALGLAFQYPKLYSAAEFYLEMEPQNQSLELLSEQLREIPGIGPWSRGVILSDISNDFSWYPYDDLAVRKGAQNLWPNAGFSNNGTEFAKQWEDFTQGELANLTAVALSGSRSV